jgi:hypothetical protein
MRAIESDSAPLATGAAARFREGNRVTFRTVAAWLGIASLSVCVPGCRPRDEFSCGTPAPSGDVARVCDRSGEVCVCSENRCARSDLTCTSGLRFVFGDTDCVPDGAELTAIDQNSVPALDRYCPGQVERPPACGVRKDGEVLTCPTAETCICSTKSCARQQSKCPTGWAWSFGGTCLPASIDVAVEAPDRVSHLCADQLPPSGIYPEDCGKSASDGKPIRCGANQACVCAVNRCANPDPTCTSVGGVGLRFARDGQCVTGIAGVATDFPDQTSGYCPGFSIGDVVP